MPTISAAQLSALQANNQNVRNICVLAHVDHGKTTLSDALISTNGIISPKLAGKIRYMDNTEAEQEKLITMKASSISLLYRHDTRHHRNRPLRPFGLVDHLVNLIDSPGHVDFSGEVSTAVRLADGALLVVDVVEGVCIQTQAVLRQAWTEKVRPVLVMNKVDRLVTELKLQPEEAYARLQNVLEQINAVMSTLWKEDLNKTFMERAYEDDGTHEWDVDEVDDSDVYFAPEKGNVVFASATDGWGFRLHQFADIYAKKLQIHRRVLLKTLWGDYFLNMKSKKILKKDNTGRLQPMFVQFILNNIWNVYTAISEKKEKKVEKIVETLGLKVPPRDLKSADTRVTLQAVMGRWLPVSDAILGTVVEHLPSPLDAQKLRIPKLWNSSLPSNMQLSPEELAQHQQLVNAVNTCDSDDKAPVLAFVSKVFALDRAAALPGRSMFVIPRKPRSAAASASSQEETKEEETAEEKEKEEEEKEDKDKVFVAFARIFSGTLHAGDKIQILGPRYNPRNPNKYRKEMVLKELYIMMGRELQRVDKVPAGNVFGIGGVEDVILKTATICSTPLCQSFLHMGFGFSPIVRVAVEAENPGEMPKLMEGLRLLNQADPCVQVLVQETGEHVIMASGELHLERCLKDLKERFAQVQITVSPPLVSFRETITSDLANGVEDDRIITMTPNKACKIRLRAIPIPNTIRRFLETQFNQQIIRKVFVENSVNFAEILAKAAEKSEEKQKKTEEKATTPSNKKPEEDELEQQGEEQEEGDELQHKEKATSAAAAAVEEVENEAQTFLNFREQMIKLFSEVDNGRWLVELQNHLWSFGPKHVGANMLLNHVPGLCDNPSWQSLGAKLLLPKTGTPSEDSERKKLMDHVLEFEGSFISGFQLATFQGPLCAEPMTGVAFVIEDIAIVQDAAENEQVKEAQLLSDSDSENIVHIETGGSNNLIPELQQQDKEKEKANNSKAANSSNYFAGTGGQIISWMKDSCRHAFMAHSVRIVEPMYLCDMQVNTATLGKATNVLSKRRARIFCQEYKEGTDHFMVQAYLPAYESFGFVNEMRDMTSGAANAQLMFSHWEVIDSDPFFIPKTEEEKEEFGEEMDEKLPPPVSKRIITDVRKRKGLAVKEKIVADAEKQRNLSRKK
ncbi:Elongation factor-like GTPase 1 [Balamuthia mandrillaris]